MVVFDGGGSGGWWRGCGGDDDGDGGDEMVCRGDEDGDEVMRCDGGGWCRLEGGDVAAGMVMMAMVMILMVGSSCWCGGVGRRRWPDGRRRRRIWRGGRMKCAR
ncbi:hypothetical protein Tco_0113791, partial [Tanacetum coccineum]